MRNLQLYPGFFLFLILLQGIFESATWQQSLLEFTLFFIILAWHEIGHLVVWKAFNIPVRLRLSLIGARFIPTVKPSLKASTLCALAGPAFSFALACALLLITPANQELSYTQILSKAVAFNILWTSFQLIPIDPLDGWFILKGACQILLGASGVRVAYGLSLTLCLCVSAICAWLSPQITWIPGSIAVFLSFRTFANAQKSLRLGPADFDPQIKHQLEQALGLKDSYRTKAAIDAFNRLIYQGQKGKMIDRARFELAQLFASQGEFAKAYLALQSCENSLTDQPLILFHQLCYQTERFDKVQAYSAKVFNLKQDASIAIMNAIACARLFEESPQKCFMQAVIGWLQAAKRLKFKNWSILETRDFKAIRQDESFASLIHTLRCFNELS